MSRLLKLIIPTLIVLAGVLYFFVFTGVIKIDSVRPPGATVHINGTVVGTTPLKQRIRAGDHQIVVSKDGFETWRNKAKVSGTSASVITVKLRFLLRSEPEGAEVIMDGKLLGTTELAIDLKPGLHNFEFRKDGYKTARFNATVPEQAGEPLPFVKLQLPEAPTPKERWPTVEPQEAGFGEIQVTSTPDAQVYLDGGWAGETPLTIRKVHVGSYVITLSREGYRDMRQTVYVKKDETSKIAGKLNPESSD